ncbi:peptidoglycan-binding protein [Streptomyces sp. NPDC056159]|uniref:peptidoglycan-binding protein n=1 Tax=Streptomyces sp. NPDC056159 TaxID=3155537 RepID=UPI003442A6D7
MLSEDEGRRRGNPPTEVEALRAELVRIKEEKQLSLTALAHDSEISRSTWNRVLKGESFPPRKEIERLSRRPRLEAQHLVGLWEAADAALKRAAAADAASPAAADGDDTATPPTATATDPAGPDSSIASVAAAAPNPSKGDALGDAATGPAPAEPMPSASPSARPDATTAAKTTPAVPRGPGARAKDRPAEPAAGASSPQATGTGGQPAAGGEQIAVQPAGAPAGEEIGVIRPVPAPAPATKNGRTTKLLITLVALTVVLLIGRWAAMPDSDKNGTAAPGTTGETLPDATDNPGEGGDTGDEESPRDTAQPSGTPPAAGSDEKPQDLPATGPGNSGSPAPRASSDTETTAPPAGQAPQNEDPPGSQAPTTTAPTTAAPSLGEEGRTACAHYKPNRRVILAKGMVGTNVGQVQCLLNHNYGYSLKEDGKFGPDTEAGVKTVQRCSGIIADGKVGPDTWKYLDYPKPACGH